MALRTMVRGTTIPDVPVIAAKTVTGIASTPMERTAFSFQQDNRQAPCLDLLALSPVALAQKSGTLRIAGRPMPMTPDWPSSAKPRTSAQKFRLISRPAIPQAESPACLTATQTWHGGLAWATITGSLEECSGIKRRRSASRRLWPTPPISMRAESPTTCGNTTNGDLILVVVGGTGSSSLGETGP